MHFLTADDFKKFQCGNQKVFNEVFKHYYPIILRYLVFHCSNKEDAEELAQEAFIILYNNRKKVTCPTKLYPYLFVIAKRLSISHFRTTHRRIQSLEDTRTDESMDCSFSAVEDYIDYKELSAIYQQIISTLPEQQRIAYSLFNEEDLSQKKIAEKMDLSPNTVRNHISLATRTIRFKLGKYYFLLLIGIFM